MTKNIADTSQSKVVKVAGFMFLFSFIVPTLYWIFVLSKLIDAENVIATANNIMANELLFRIGITIELIMSLGLVVLALTLYTILKPVNNNLALLALLLKLIEATIVVAIALVSFIALQILIFNGETYLTAFTPEQLQAFVGLILNAHTTLYSIPMVFLGLDMMIFSYLFFKSKYIPKILAGFGILSFALILIHALMYIIAPKYAMMPISQMIFYAPSGLFEIIIGTWLLSKGITKPNKLREKDELK